MMKEGFIAQLQTVRQFFLNTTGCLTEEDSGYAPKEEMFTVAQQVEHVAQTMNWFVDGAFGEDGFDMNFEDQVAQLKECTSLELARQHFEQAVAYAIKALRASSEEELMTPFPDGPIMGGVPKMGIISGIEDHTAHHRGVLSVYARLLGKVPSMPYGEA